MRCAKSMSKVARDVSASKRAGGGSGTRNESKRQLHFMK